MIDNNNLIKYFVRVPVGTTFNGAEVSNANATNQKKIYFDENTQQIWVKGKAFSLDKAYATKIDTLIGADSAKSVRTIAGEVVTTALNLTDNADATINTLKEVLNWFDNLPEGDAGALALVSAVGHPAKEATSNVYYTQEEADAYNTANGYTEGMEMYVTTSTVKEYGQEAQPATGLYKLIDDKIGDIDYSSFATISYVTTELAAGLSGKEDLTNKVTSIDGNSTDTEYPTALAVHNRIGDLGSYIASPAVYYGPDDLEVMNGTAQEGELRTPAVMANYSYVMHVIQDNERVTAAALTDLDTRLQSVTGDSVTGVTIGETDLTVSDHVAYISKADLQSELFDNTYVSSPLSYSYLGVTVSLKESNGELTYLNIDPSELVNRVSNVEEFDPWEEYVEQNGGNLDMG